MVKIRKNVLMVEGAEDKRTIPYLVEANGIQWEVNQQPIVYIKQYEGVENLIDEDEIKYQLNESKLEALGIIVDADDSCEKRWQSIKNACLEIIPDLPDKLPETGLVHNVFTDNEKLIKFGVWIMPDNKIAGMLETFLAYLIPDEVDYFWVFDGDIAIFGGWRLYHLSLGRKVCAPGKE